MYGLFSLIFFIAAAILDNIFGLTFDLMDNQSWYGIIYILYGLATLLPSLAVLVRRLHDIGKGGGWIFIAFIPFIGGIWLLILMLTAGEKGENRFGEDPKA